MSEFSNRTITKQIFGTGGLGIVGQVASFLGVIAYTRLAPRDVLGSYFLLVGLLHIASFLGTTGVSSDITRQINQKETPERELATAITFILIVASVLSALTVLGQPVINTYIDHELAIALAALLPISMFATFSGSVLRGEKKNARAVALRTIQKIATYSIGSMGIVFGINPAMALVGGLLCGKLVELGGGVTLIGIYPAGVPNLTDLTQLVQRVYNLTIVGIGNLGQQWIDTLLIGAFLSPAAVAVYEVAWRLSAFGLIGTNAVVSVLYPRFADAAEDGRHREIQKYAEKAFFYVMVPLFALIAGAFALGTELVTILYGSEYAAAFLPLLILLAGRVPYSLSRITTVLSYSYHLDRSVTKASVLAALVNGGANIVLIPWIGIVGAAIGSLLSYTLIAILLFHVLADKTGYPAVSNLVPILLASGIMFLCIRPLSAVFPSNPRSLILLVAIGAVIYCTTLLLLSSTVRRDLWTFLLGAE